MKILFITPETSRTGAPLVLLHFMKWMLNHEKAYKISVLSLKKGDLNQEFVTNSHSFYDYELLTALKKGSLIQRVLRKFRLIKNPNKASQLFSQLGHENFNIIYSNTVKSIPTAEKIIASSNGARHIAHIHELNVIIRLLLPNLEEYLPQIDRVIAPSDLVKNALIDNWNVPSNKIRRVYECSYPYEFDDSQSKNDCLHIGGSGTVHWRKGYDIFIQVALYIKNKYPELKILFTWVGKLYELERLIIEEDSRKLKLNNMVNFVGEVDNPHSIFKSFDVFLMTSREDPFPLVCIEVGMLGKPIICFDNATGISEIIIDQGGYIVPYLNIEEMAEKVIKYFDNPQELKNHGNYNKSAFSHFTPNEICPQLMNVVKELDI